MDKEKGNVSKAGICALNYLEKKCGPLGLKCDSADVARSPFIALNDIF